VTRHPAALPFRCFAPRLEYSYSQVRGLKHKIAKSDAILVLNFDDERGRGWIGANTFLEIGFAHVLGKKIFVVMFLDKLTLSLQSNPG
jgi:hypothetical protein